MATCRLGLTGGIGSGKSTVAAILVRLGATVIDADAISRNLTARGGGAISAIKDAFGSAVLTAERALDRDGMRRLVFSNPQAKRQLENIIHPLVGREIQRQTEAAQCAAVPCLVLDIPLLVESSHWRRALPRILVVDCTQATQIARVTSRNGMDSCEVQRIIASQTSRTQRLKAADCVLYNDGIDMAALEREVRQIGTLFGL